MALADVSLAGGMVVSCLQKHEVPILDLEVQGYLKHLELRPGDTVFDVGANIGLFSLAVHERCQQDVRLYAFEPVKAIYEVLRANLARHGTGDQLRSFEFGFSSHSEDTTFAYYPGAPNLSTAYPIDSDDLAIMREAVLNNIMHLAQAPRRYAVCAGCHPGYAPGSSSTPSSER